MTNSSPFNSQTALVTENKSFSGDNRTTSNNYYAENLKNGQKSLRASRIYDSLHVQTQNVDYKQLDPLLSDEHSQDPSTIIIMDTQNVKPAKDTLEPLEKPSMQFQKDVKLSPTRFANQVTLNWF